jgi:hypothetical protein
LKQFRIVERACLPQAGIAESKFFLHIPHSEIRDQQWEGPLL